MDEASKTKKIWDETMYKYMQGKGLDVGCGPDPLFPDIDPFDVQHGDANQIGKFLKKQYDYVFSSHCLEHMHDPAVALQGWLSLVKPGGHLIVLVPDEDLYEQGIFPSVFNDDHKWTFTISKAKSWSPKSVNVVDLVKRVGGELISVELHDCGYDRGLMRHRPSRYSVLLGKVYNRLKRYDKKLCCIPKLKNIFYRCGATIDQTALGEKALAQIQFIVKKP